jgi:hypothetical protein
MRSVRQNPNNRMSNISLEAYYTVGWFGHLPRAYQRTMKRLFVCWCQMTYDRPGYNLATLVSK